MVSPVGDLCMKSLLRSFGSLLTPADVPRLWLSMKGYGWGRYGACSLLIFRGHGL